MSLERERALPKQWRAHNELAKAQQRVSHNVDEHNCYTCELCRALESCLAELDRITGAGFDGSSGSTPLGSI